MVAKLLSKQKENSNRIKANFAKFEVFLTCSFARVVQGHLKMASFTSEEALAMVFHDSESELSEESNESDESSGNDNTTGDTTDSSTSNPNPTNIHWEFYSYLDPFE